MWFTQFICMLASLAEQWAPCGQMESHASWHGLELFALLLSSSYIHITRVEDESEQDSILSKKVSNTMHTDQLQHTENILNYIWVRLSCPGGSNVPGPLVQQRQQTGSSYLRWPSFDMRVKTKKLWPSFSFEIPPFIIFESVVSTLCFELNTKIIWFCYLTGLRYSVFKILQWQRMPFQVVFRSLPPPIFLHFWISRMLHKTKEKSTPMRCFCTKCFCRMSLSYRENGADQEVSQLTQSSHLMLTVQQMHLHKLYHIQYL